MIFKRYFNQHLFILLFLGDLAMANEVPDVSKIIKLKLGESYSLSNAVTIRLTEHSHKRTHVGQVSPFIIYMDYLKKGKVLETKQFNVFKDEKKFDWREFHLELINNEYGKWSEIRITNIK
jgi:hypothetical protein